MIFSKIKESFIDKINNVFRSNEEFDAILDELEETLILSDIGAKTSMDIIAELRKRMLKSGDKSKENIIKCLKEEMINIISGDEDMPDIGGKKVILVVGVNGVGKTTSIAKLTKIYKDNGKKVLLTAGDTFRAGAIKQLEIWAEVAGVECISGKEGADPASVIFDGTEAFAKSSNDILICDTAGRLHNKKKLMDELDKIKRTIEKNVNGAEIEVLMVIDATTGQNAIEQVKAFYDKTSVDGIILTKLDSTSKGGIVFSIINELRIPVKYIGIGEKIDDMKLFNAKEFVDSII